MIRWFPTGLLPLLLAQLALLGTAMGQDLQLLKPSGPFSDGIAVESLQMQAPGDFSLSLHLNHAEGILDSVDPVSLRRISVIDAQSALALSIGWQQTENLRFQLSLRGRYLSGYALDQFSGSGFAAGDTLLGVRWRFVNATDLGLRLGVYGTLFFPTGHTEKLSGAGATSVAGGLMLSQRFDDLTFRGSIGYVHRSQTAVFADAHFSHVIDFSAGLYIPLDWPHWLIFTETIGQLNASEQDIPGTEPLEIFGGVTYGQFTQFSIGASTGLNEEGGSAARRFAVRVTHHFGAEQRDLNAIVVPAGMNSDMPLDRRTQMKVPKLTATAPSPKTSNPTDFVSVTSVPKTLPVVDEPVVNEVRDP